MVPSLSTLHLQAPVAIRRRRHRVPHRCAAAAERHTIALLRAAEALDQEGANSAVASAGLGIPTTFARHLRLLPEST